MLLVGGQAAPNYRPHMPPVAHNTPEQKTSVVNVPLSTKPQVPAADLLATSSSLEDKHPMSDASGSMNIQCSPNQSMEAKQFSPIATEDPSVSDNSHDTFENYLQMPQVCTQENDPPDSCILLPNPGSAYCDWMKMHASQFTPHLAAPTQQHIVMSVSHPDQAGESHASDLKQHIPDARGACAQSHHHTTSKYSSPPLSSSDPSSASNCHTLPEWDQYCDVPTTSESATGVCRCACVCAYVCA